MKTRAKLALVFAMFLGLNSAFGQFEVDRDIQQYRFRDFRGINQFEALGTDIAFDGMKVRLGGAFAVQMQALSHQNTTLNDSTNQLIDLGNNFNLPTANLDIDVALADGMRMHMRTYLSSRHHPESWVKGGYIQISNLNWIRKGLLENIMDITTVKVGLMEINYGDMHFRRTDNARAIYNPFVGNLLMDAFNTEAGAEVYFNPGDFLIMAGVTNGKLNQSVATNNENTPAFLAKVGWDKQMNEDLRVRLTSSLYTSAEGNTNYLYFGDRAGSRYYLVNEAQGANPTDNSRSGRVNPSFINEVTSIMINPFVKYKGFEFLGAFETSSGKISAETKTRTYTQVYAELVYRFGKEENFYVGGRYNSVAGQLPNFNPNASPTDITVNRMAFAAGWYMTKNVMMKAEYVTQTYDGYADTDILHEAQFDGFVIEAAISF
ncbi:MAG: hypothetical protein DA405_03720 [Bacteroidetes bacterium]|nr:MAG: hypothetical protein DA405_03720 [Bacteroidota bacterium]